MYGIKDGKIESELKDVISDLNNLRTEVVGSRKDDIIHCIALLNDVQIKLGSNIEVLQKIANLAGKLHGLVKREKRIQKVVDENL